MNNSHLSKLLDRYTEERNPAPAMSAAQFEKLLLFFPGLLITVSDGIIDDEEWIYIKYLARFSAAVFKNDLTKEELTSLQDNYFREFKFLLDNLDQWQDSFLTTLQEYLKDNEDEKDTVLDALYLFAEASDGTSEEEERAIKNLTEKLNLES